MLYKIAHKIWNTALRIWSAFIVLFLVSSLANLAVVQEPNKTLLGKAISWLLNFGSLQVLILIICLLIIALTFAAGIITMIGKHAQSSKGKEENDAVDDILRQYLASVVDANQGLNPRGFFQSQALISVNVPLDEIFIHLQAVPDRPVYDMPSEQQRLLEELRQRTDLSPEEREELIQRLRVIWYSQLGQELIQTPQEPATPARRVKRNIGIEEVLQGLPASNPVAIVLGAPGSGKSTAMRWLALHMARATLSEDYLLPKGLWVKQIPILLHISDYAKRLHTTHDLSFEQFFIEAFDRLQAGLSKRLLAELKKGRCLVLFDGLDEVASDDLRRRVAQAIHKFIGNYSTIIEEKTIILKRPARQLPIYPPQPRTSYPIQRRTLYSPRTRQRYNHFVITSRIVGYEAGSFVSYAHYTLLDLKEKQINQFLTKWCPAVERYQTMFAQGMEPLTPWQEAQVETSGIQQRDRLLDAIRNSPGIKRLAVNPLMLTILALIQRSGKTLPHRRIELYQIVTRTLLDNWNKESGRKFFSLEEIPLAEQLLSNLAFRLHSSDPVLTEQDVKTIARQSMNEFYGHTSDQISDSTIQQFIETLRSSSGLFVESGQGLFSFMHRTFQEYFVALYLLRKTQEALKEFVVTHYQIAIWREPVLLIIAYKSGQNSRSERQEASDLIQAIADANNTYDTLLHRNLLFAATSIVDCNAWSIDKLIQQRIANQLFEIYGDILGNGRYTQLQKEVEDVALLWLRGQPQESSQQHSLPPLLQAWCTALCDGKHSMLQEGAAHLLFKIASSLQDSPPSVLHTFSALLIQFAELNDFPHPFKTSLQPLQTHYPLPPRIKDYAWATLCRLGKAGSGGWLRNACFTNSAENPQRLEHLRQHMIELNHRIDPGPIDPDPADAIGSLYAYILWQLIEYEQMEASKYQPWRDVWDVYLREEMAHGRSATYQASLNLRLLLRKGNKQQCKEIGNELVKALSTDEQQQAQVLNALINIYLRNLPGHLSQTAETDTGSIMRRLIETDEVAEGDEWEELGFIGEDPLEERYGNSVRPPYMYEDDPLLQEPVQRTNIPRARRSSGSAEKNLPSLWRSLRREQTIQARLPRAMPRSSTRPTRRYRLLEALLAGLQAAKEELSNEYEDAAELEEVYESAAYVLPAEEEWYEEYSGHRLTGSRHLPAQVYSRLPAAGQSHAPVSHAPVISDLQYLLDLLDLQNALEDQQVEDIRSVLNHDLVTVTLCETLSQKSDTLSSSVLLALYSIIGNDSPIVTLPTRKLYDCIQTFEQQTLSSLTAEHRLLIAAILQQTNNLDVSAKAKILDTLERKSQLNGGEVETLLTACIYKPALPIPSAGQSLPTPGYPIPSAGQSAPIYSSRRRPLPSSSESTIRRKAWNLLTRGFSLEADALPVLIKALDDQDVAVCAGAALLLRHSSKLPESIREETARKILRLLTGEVSFGRTVGPPDGSEVMILDDVLYETLKVLAE